MITFGTDRWQHVENVHVRGFVFRYGATVPAWGICSLDGKNNRVEDCLIEEASNNGILVKGTMRRCVFRRNHAQGLWLDCHVRNVLITECVFDCSWETGLFIEISRDIYVLRNLFVGNGNVPGTKHYWSDAGIKLGESMNCVVAYNTCVGNKDGITMREGEGRPEKTEDYGDIVYHCRGNVITGNVCAGNDGYQLGLWYDNGLFGMHPADKKKFAGEEAFAAQLDPKKVYDPVKVGHIIDRNVYDAGPGQKIALYGVPWRVKHQKFADLSSFAAKTGFDRAQGRERLDGRVPADMGLRQAGAMT
jgi:parallel beta-helix repeat protein